MDASYGTEEELHSTGKVWSYNLIEVRNLEILQKSDYSYRFRDCKTYHSTLCSEENPYFRCLAMIRRRQNFLTVKDQERYYFHRPSEVCILWKAVLEGEYISHFMLFNTRSKHSLKFNHMPQKHCGIRKIIVEKKRPDIFNRRALHELCMRIASGHLINGLQIL